MVKNDSTVGRCKHIDVKYQYAKTEVREENVDVKYVPTDQNIADMFTKPLGRLKYEQFANMLFKHKVHD